MISSAKYKLPFKINTRKDLHLKIKVPLEVLERYFERLKISEKDLVMPIVSLKKDGVSTRTVYDTEQGLKKLNRRINKLLFLIKLPHAFKGGVKGGKIQDNALVHRGNKYMQKIDIKNFFPSVKAIKIRELLIRVGFLPAVATFLTRLITCEGLDPQGYPTAGTIANIYMANYCYDQIQAILGENIVATYWSDDITLSSKQPIPHKKVSRIIGILKSSGLEAHRKKTESVGRNCKKVVTGIEVGDEVIRPEKTTIKRLESTLHQLRKDTLEHIALTKYSEDEKRLKSKQLPADWMIKHIKGVLQHIKNTNENIYQRILSRYADIIEKYKITENNQIQIMNTQSLLS